MQLMSFAVPDAKRWLSLYSKQERELDRMKEGNDWNDATMGHSTSTKKSGSNSTGATNPYMMRKVTTEKQFVADMLLHHQAAVTMANQALLLSLRPDIRDMAKDIISSQTTEIKIMKDWIAAWKGE